MPRYQQYRAPALESASSKHCIDRAGHIDCTGTYSGLRMAGSISLACPAVRVVLLFVPFGLFARVPTTMSTVIHSPFPSVMGLASNMQYPRPSSHDIPNLTWSDSSCPPPLHPSVDLMRRSASSRRMASKEGKKATAGPECRVSQMHSHPVTCGSAPCLWWRGPRSWSFPVGQHAPASRMGLDRHGGFNCLLIRERGAGFLRVSPLPRTRDRFCVERSGLSDPIMSTTARTASRVQRLPATNSSNPPQAGQTAGTVGNLMDARGY